MKRFLTGLLAVLSVAAVASNVPAGTKDGGNKVAASRAPGLVAHEWGSWMTVQGSDGIFLDGVRGALPEAPAFVQRWQKLAQEADSVARERSMFIGPPLAVPAKPVLYFYAEKETAVSVVVGLPDGLWTEWYPRADRVLPAPTRANAGQKGGGSLVWSKVTVVAKDAGKDLPSPADAEDHPWYPALRDVDANWVTVGRAPQQTVERERFLFYRGAAYSADAVALRIRTGEDGRVTVSNAGKAVLGKLAVVRIEEGKAAFRVGDGPEAGKDLDLGKVETDLDLKDLAGKAAPELEKILTEAGLFEKEAAGMVRVWTQDWLKNPGLRVLYLVDRATVDRLMPLQIKPAPESLVRVLVGRVEAMTPALEKEIGGWIAELGSKTDKIRDRARDRLSRMGKAAEPLLRKALKETKDETVRKAVEELIEEARS